MNVERCFFGPNSKDQNLGSKAMTICQSNGEESGDREDSRISS
jgi:hypothetical protein